MHAALDWPPCVAQIQSFSSWLHTHAPLVRSFQLNADSADGKDEQGQLRDEIADEYDEYQKQLSDADSADEDSSADEEDKYQAQPGDPRVDAAAALLLLQEALEAAAAAGTHADPPAAAAATAATAAVAGADGLSSCDHQQDHQQPQQQLLQQPCLQLASFSSGHSTGAALLSALPAHSLTHLDLFWEERSSSEQAALPAALAKMTNLQQLQLRGILPGKCLTGLAGLTQLTSLKMVVERSSSDQLLQQQQLLALPLQLKQLHVQLDPIQLMAIDNMSFTHLTCLTELTAPGCCWFETQLPTQLQVLELSAPDSSHLNALSTLQQLQRLSFAVTFEDTVPLLRLTQQLPALQLQDLALAYQAADVAAATAPVWGRLPQLRALSVKYECNVTTMRQIAMITAGLAAATSLTKLQLAGESAHHDEAGWGEDEDSLGPAYDSRSLCSIVAGLPLLQDLSITAALEAAGMCSGNWLAADEVAALTALTGLSRLVLVSRDGWFGDSALDALLGSSSLAQLRELELKSCDSYSRQCVAGIGRMSQLTRLRLAGKKQWPDAESQQGLLLLAGLTSLRKLQLCSRRKVSREVLGSLRASLPDARVRWCKWEDEWAHWRELL